MARHDHIVQFYEDDGWLLDQLAERFLPLLQRGQAVIVVGTKLHREGLKHRLKRRRIDIAAAIAEERYVERDADETLRQFMRYDKVDSARFRQVVSDLVTKAQRKDRAVVIFGEMVAQLWFEGKREAALYLEQLWNGLIKERRVDLICAYPMSGFSRASHDQLLANICSEHTHVLSSESYADLNEEQRGAAITQLQQRAQALATEIRIAEERAALLQAAAGLGTWEMDMVDETIALSSNAQRLLGVATTSRITLPELLRVMCYSGDRDVFLAALKKSRTGRKEFSVEFRVQAGDDVRLLSADGKLYYNHGQPVLIAILRDAGAGQSAVA